MNKITFNSPDDLKFYADNPNYFRLEYCPIDYCNDTSYMFIYIELMMCIQLIKDNQPTITLHSINSNSTGFCSRGISVGSFINKMYTCKNLHEISRIDRYCIFKDAKITSHKIKENNVSTVLISQLSKLGKPNKNGKIYPYMIISSANKTVIIYLDNNNFILFDVYKSEKIYKSPVHNIKIFTCKSEKVDVLASIIEYILEDLKIRDEKKKIYISKISKSNGHSSNIICHKCKDLYIGVLSISNCGDLYHVSCDIHNCPKADQIFKYTGKLSNEIFKIFISMEELCSKYKFAPKSN